MKLKDLNRKTSYTKIKGANGEEVNAKFESLSVIERSEKDKYFPEAKKEALVFVRANAGKIMESVERMGEITARDSLIAYYKRSLPMEEDLIEVENEKIMTEGDVNKAKNEVIIKANEALETKIKNMSIDGVKFELCLLELQQTFSMKMIDLMNVKILSLITKDPESGAPLLSMDKDSEDYWGDISSDVIDQMLRASEDVRSPLLQKEIRRLSEDPDFLSLWGYLKKKA
jgi:hypothetical protein